MVRNIAKSFFQEWAARELLFFLSFPLDFVGEDAT